MKKIAIRWKIPIKIIFFVAFVIACAFTITINKAWALPSLQLGLDPSLDTTYYRTNDQTWVINADGPFTLSAFAVDQDFGSNAGDAFPGTDTTAFLAIALGGSFDGSEDPSGFGTLAIDGYTVPFNDEWIYGDSPLADQTVDEFGNSLPPHGIYPTWFTAYSFDFSDGLWTQDVYDTQPGENGKDTGFQKDFLINLSGLDSTITSVHFDLYTKTQDGIYKFAPFSHDAEAAPVPEPSTILLFGSGIFGLVGMVRKLKK
jgi:hypothetical protein